MSVIGIGQRASGLAEAARETLEEVVTIADDSIEQVINNETLQTSLNEAFAQLNQTDFNQLIENLDLESLTSNLGDLTSNLGDALQTLNLSELSEQVSSLAQNTLGDLSSQFLDLSSNLQSINFALSEELLNTNFEEAQDILQRLNRELPGEFDQMLRQLEQQGVIVIGSTAGGLMAPPSARAPATTTSYVGTSSSSAGGGTDGSGADDITGRQPGRLAGTRVSFANSDPNQVPRQQIIDTLNEMCNRLNIDIRITPQGGWTGRDTGTQNHPTGFAADFQVIRNGAPSRPTDEVAIYRDCAQTLQAIANEKEIRPGIGSYRWGLHYDESPWRQNQWPSNKVAFWQPGFTISGVLTA